MSTLADMESPNGETPTVSSFCTGADRGKTGARGRERFVHKQAQQCGQRRKALRRYGGQRRAAHAPGEYGDEQPVQQDVAQQAENHDGHCGDGTPASAQQRVQSAVEYLQAARQHDDNGVIRRGLVQLACCAKQAEQPRV